MYLCFNYINVQFFLILMKYNTYTEKWVLYISISYF